MATKNRITFRNAAPADLPLMRYWDSKKHVIECDPDGDWNWDAELSRNPDWREQIIAELDGEPLGFVQMIDAHREETHYWGAVLPHTKAVDIWTGEESNLSKGYGTILMRMAIAQCFSDPKTSKILLGP